MRTILKQVVGIDVAKDELVVSLGRLDGGLDVEIFAGRCFANRTTGFSALKDWAERHLGADVGILYVMEATGVYHEALAHWLCQNGCGTSVVLPNKVSNFFRTLKVNTVTDKSASEAIARFGLERKLDDWERPKQIYGRLKQLSRERGQLVEERTMLRNQLHAEKAEAFPNPRSIARIQQRIELIDSQEKDIRKEMSSSVSQEEGLRQKVSLITSIPGIGELTATIVMAETNGFELIRNKRQLVSYCGLDVRAKESGTSVKGRPKISKKGNRHIRRALHLPSLAAIKHDRKWKSAFDRLVSRHGIKMKAVVAVQRKLLEMIYVIWKNNVPYDMEYQSGMGLKTGHGAVNS